MCLSLFNTVSNHLCLSSLHCSSFSFVCLSLSQMELCLASDILCSKLPAVHRCATALLAIAGGEEEEVNEDKNSTSVSPSSPFSTGFLLFYSLLMALLYMLYCQLIAQCERASMCKCNGYITSVLCTHIVDKTCIYIYIKFPTQCL